MAVTCTMAEMKRRKPWTRKGMVRIAGFIWWDHRLASRNEHATELNASMDLRNALEFELGLDIVAEPVEPGTTRQLVAPYALRHIDPETFEPGEAVAKGTIRELAWLVLEMLGDKYTPHPDYDGVRTPDEYAAVSAQADAEISYIA